MTMHPSDDGRDLSDVIAKFLFIMEISRLRRMMIDRYLDHSTYCVIFTKQSLSILT